MKPTFSILIATLIAANVVMATPALSANTDSSSLPPEAKQGNVNFVTGGIGKDEAAVFQRAAKNFPLELEFVMKDKPKDAFLADVNVTIRNHFGEMVLDITSQGPFLLATLPPGKYDVTADIAGSIKHKVVSINTHEYEMTVLEWEKSDNLNSNQ